MIITREFEKIRSFVRVLDKLNTSPVIFDIDKGFKGNAMNKSQTILTYYSLRASMFEEFDFLNRKGYLKIDPTDFLKRTAKMDKNSKVSIDANDRYIILLERGETTNTRIQIPQTSEGEIEKPKDKFNYEGFVEVKLKPIDQAIKKLKGEYTIIISNTNKTITFKDDENNQIIEIFDDYVVQNDLKDVKVRVSLEYLAPIFMVLKKFYDSVRIYIKDNYPLKLEFLGDHDSIVFIIAPRI